MFFQLVIILLLQNCRPSLRDIQRIPEVMRDDARKLIETTILPPEFLLSLLSLTDVEVDTDGSDWLTVLVALGDFTDTANSRPRSIGSSHPVLDVVAIGLTGDVFIKRLLHTFEVVGMSTPFPRLKIWLNFCERMA